MRKLIDIKRFTFYMWVGFSLASLGSIYYLLVKPESFFQGTLNNIWAAPYVTVLNYILFEYTLKKLSTKKLLKSFLLLVAHIFLYSLGMYLWRSVGITLHIYTSFSDPKSISHVVSDRMAYSMESIFFFGIIRHVYNYIRLKQDAQQLRIEKQQSELNYLKSQTNPHFLFNTLNNIYSLSRDKSDLAPESILRLSKILRFMLYESSADYISIEQELKVITDYIALEKLRYDESLILNFNYDVEDMKQAVTPLLLMPLVENAFKHGASETRGRPFISIHLSVGERKLNFIVKNSIEALSGSAGVKENIGLSNLRRQLEMLYTDYDLSVGQSGSLFIASLKINLASHV